MGCLKLTYQNNYEVGKNYFKKELTLNFSKKSTCSPYQITGAIPLQPHKILALDNNLFTRTLGKKTYEINDHLGNVRAVVSDLKHSTLIAGIPNDYEPDIVATNNYYAFGMLQPNRHFGKSRYGFNGKENLDEVTGSPGNHLDFGARIYDSRLGRFFSVDPATKLYAYYSPYQFAGNKPIDHIDYNGEHEWKITYIHNSTGKIIQTKLQLVKRGNFSAITPHWYNSKHFVIKADGSIGSFDVGDGTNWTSRPTAPVDITKRTDKAIPTSNRTWQNKNKDGVPTRSNNISMEVWTVGVDPVSAQPSVPYSMNTFNSSSSFQQGIMTQPDKSTLDAIGVLASEFKNGLVTKIAIEIRTNLGENADGVKKSNNLRQQGLIDALVSAGIKRDDIEVLPQKYNQKKWDGEVSFERILKPSVEEK